MIRRAWSRIVALYRRIPWWVDPSFWLCVGAYQSFSAYSRGSAGWAMVGAWLVGWTVCELLTKPILRLAEEQNRVWSKLTLRFAEDTANATLRAEQLQSELTLLKGEK